MALCRRGFALIEVLIAITILSIVIVSLYSGVSNGALAIAQSRNLTKAIIIARSKLKEFQLENLRGTDLNDVALEEYPGFYYTREIAKFEHELIPALISTQQVKITVYWTENGRKRDYSIDYIYVE